ncbi:hypothetical protein SAMN02745116_02087 [Pilibacter termitis]|uniref:Uncharacterized protein n=1 Tax=Pilibacter termitis TaxID=263852 RepID=A0A1T4Q771_9ENTE|nr:hypothetical protein [Pilibacter termitis]SJZ99526.1 hypothetical protein SAMN02745116_02087 [Pilibacter termitis]
MKRTTIEKLIFIAIVVGFCFALYITPKHGKLENEPGGGKKPEENEARTILYHGKFDQLANNSQELETKSPIIVVAKKLSDTQHVETTEDGTPKLFYSMSKVKIIKIEKDESKKLKIGDVIQCLEESVTNVEVDEEKVNLSLEGYRKMLQDSEYLLFLRPSTTGDNYVLTNSLLSKYAVSGEEPFDNPRDENPISAETEKLQKSYFEIYDELEEKYDLDR